MTPAPAPTLAELRQRLRVWLDEPTHQSLAYALDLGTLDFECADLALLLDALDRRDAALREARKYCHTNPRVIAMVDAALDPGEGTT